MDLKAAWTPERQASAKASVIALFWSVVVAACILAFCGSVFFGYHAVRWAMIVAKWGGLITSWLQEGVAIGTLGKPVGYLLDAMAWCAWGVFWCAAHGAVSVALWRWFRATYRQAPSVEDASDDPMTIWPTTAMQGEHVRLRTQYSGL